MLFPNYRIKWRAAGPARSDGVVYAVHEQDEPEVPADGFPIVRAVLVRDGWAVRWRWAEDLDPVLGVSPIEIPTKVVASRRDAHFEAALSLLEHLEEIKDTIKKIRRAKIDHDAERFRREGEHLAAKQERALAVAKINGLVQALGAEEYSVDGTPSEAEKVVVSWRPLVRILEELESLSGNRRKA